MARLPTVADLGRRPVPNPQRGVTRLSAAEAPGAALADFGASVEAIGDEMFLRDATAAAKERDTYASNELRRLLYDPENGYMNLQGRAAVDARPRLLEQIEALKTKAGDGLGNTAKDLLSNSLNRRVESALTSIDQHASGARATWLKGASDARITAFQEDALFDFARTREAIAGVTQELREQGAEAGEDAAVTNGKIRDKVSGIYRAQIERVKATDPIAAMEYLREHQDDMAPSDVAYLEQQLSGEVKKATGRAIGREAVASMGDMSDVIKVAQNTLGMNETEQREALAEFFKNGGINLDPSTQAWCAAWANGALAGLGIQGTGSAMARSFLEWGMEVSDPQMGDVVVLSRGDPNGWEGHVGFFMGYDDKGNILVLGGNQSDAVNVQAYSANRLLGFRREVAEYDPETILQQRQRILEATADDPIARAAALDEFEQRTQTAASLQDVQDREAGVELGRQYANEVSTPEDIATRRKMLMQEENETVRAAALQEFDAQTGATTDAKNTRSAEEGRRIGAEAARNAGGDPVKIASEMARIAKMTDQQAREAAINELSVQSAAMQGEITARQEQARIEAYDLIEGGIGADDLPSSIADQLTPEAKSSLRSWEATIKAGRQPERNDAEYLRLYDLYAENPKAFAAEDPATWKNKLSPADWDKLVALRTAIKTGQRESADAYRAMQPQAVSSMLTQAKSALDLAGIEEGTEEHVAFQTELIDWAAQNPQASNDEQAVQQKVDRMLAKIVLDPRGGGNSMFGTNITGSAASGFAYQANFGGKPLNPNDDVTLDMVMDAKTFTIDGEPVPAWLAETFMYEYAMREYTRTYGGGRYGPTVPKDVASRAALAAWARKNNVAPSAQEFFDAMLSFMSRL